MNKTGFKVTSCQLFKERMCFFTDLLAVISLKKAILTDLTSFFSMA